MSNRWPMLTIIVFLANCSDKPPPDLKALSEPEDVFVATLDEVEHGGSSPRNWHSSALEPWFETTLRPTRMRARYPSAYLRWVGHFYQPWAKEIWDEVRAGFTFPALEPLARTKMILLRTKFPSDGVVLQLGGFSESGIPKVDIFADVRNLKVIDTGAYRFVTFGHERLYQFHDPLRADLDGTPATMTCWSRSCDAELTLPPHFASAPPLPGHSIWGGHFGSKIKISFAASRLRDWPEIRRVSICFAGLSTIGFDLQRAFGGRKNPCGDVRAAIRAATSVEAARKT